MKKRYGFIYVDKDNEGNGTLARSRKKSFAWYQQVIASNGENLSSMNVWRWSLTRCWPPVGR